MRIGFPLKKPWLEECEGSLTPQNPSSSKANQVWPVEEAPSRVHLESRIRAVVAASSLQAPAEVQRGCRSVSNRVDFPRDVDLECRESMVGWRSIFFGMEFWRGEDEGRSDEQGSHCEKRKRESKKRKAASERKVWQSGVAPARL